MSDYSDIYRASFGSDTPDDDNTPTPSDATIEQNGGLTRFRAGATGPAAQPFTPPAPTQVHSGAFRFQAGGSGPTVQHLGQASYIQGQEPANGSVMATRQRVAGHDTVELIPGNPASRTQLKTALAEGLIEAVAPGLYRDKAAPGAPTPQGTQQGPTEAQEEPLQDPGAGVFDPVEDAEWNAAIDPVPQHAFNSAAASVVVAVLQGADNLDTAAKRLSEQAGMSPEESKELTQHGYSFYESMVSKEATSAGIADKEGFYAWMRDRRGGALQEAMQFLVAGRDISRFRTLALEFKNKAR